MVIPGLGAVCPATVRYGFRMSRREVSTIVPDTSKTTVRGPDARSAALSDPAPESFRLVTRWIVVDGVARCRPDPAGVVVP
jgi:hypothetical protein